MEIELKEHIFLKMPWTIEQQLDAYSTDTRRTERHEILNTSWKQLKRWLSEMLEYTVLTFPTYSQHNVTHCQAVLHNIECLLGEEEIRRLSPTDCFAILLTVYLHDVGMCILDDDRENMIQENDFCEMIDSLENSADFDFRRAVNCLKQKNYSPINLDKQEKKYNEWKALYKKKLDVYSAIVLLVGEYQRRQHAQYSAERMKKMVLPENDSHNGFSMTGIPVRIFLQVAECARMHGEWEFESIFENLLDSDNGFAQDKYHPRFIAVMLLLGDALDIDNNRFNPFMQEYAGSLITEKSLTHLRKHRSIRSIKITSQKIRIQAECEKTEELRALRQDFDWLTDFIKKCSYRWSEIAPENYRGYLPSLEISKIRLNQSEIPSDLITSRFSISQKKAFKMMEGANLYSNRYVFLREVIQNATDATKMQYWNDLEALNGSVSTTLQLFSANEILAFERYPICIDYEVVKCSRQGKNQKISSVTAEDIEMDVSDFNQDYEVGILVRIQDCGIGISENDIRSISRVGESHERQKTIIDQMPQWLRPNGHFGIGLQSIFLAGKSFKCITRTRQERCYEISFHSGSQDSGYIDVLPKEIHSQNYRAISYGTCFSFFVGESYKESHEKNSAGWAGVDPYIDNYENYRGVRRSLEMMLQMEEYIDELVGDAIFPIIQREKTLHQSLCDKNLDKILLLKNRIPCSHTVLKTINAGDGEGMMPIKIGYWSHWFQDKVLSNEPYFLRGNLSDGSAYYFDEEHCKLYIWSQKVDCFFCCSSEKIIRKVKMANLCEDTGEKIKIFVKGLKILELSSDENDLIEYIDIKSEVLQNYLQMNRSSLSEGGAEIIEKKIIPELFATLFAVLTDMNQIAVKQIKKNKKEIITQLCGKYEDYLAFTERKSDLEDTKTYNLGDYKKKHSQIPEVFSNINKKSSRLEAKLTSLPPEKFCLFMLSYGMIEEQGTGMKGKCGEIEESLRKHFSKNNAIKKLWEEIRTKDIIFLWQMRVYSFECIQMMQESEIDLPTYILEHFKKHLMELMQLLFAEEITQVSSLRLDEVTRKASILQKYVVFYAMCFYFVKKSDSGKLKSCFPDQKSYCYWQMINTQIADMLHFINKVLEKMTPENNDKRMMQYEQSAKEIYKNELFLQGILENNWREIRYFSFADIMILDNKFGVFSSRENKKDHWKHVLIKLETMDQSFLKRFHLKSNTSIIDVSEMNNCVLKWKVMDEWFQHVINILIPASGEKKESILHIDDQYCYWLVHKLPSLLLGSDESGNYRLNVLEMEEKNHVFLDLNMTRLLFERMFGYWKENGTLKFRTTTWGGMEELNCSKGVSTNIKRVDRGITSDSTKKYQMLLAVKYEIPEQALMPSNVFYIPDDEKGMPDTLLGHKICNLKELLEELQDVYQEPVSERAFKWNLIKTKQIVAVCEEISKNIIFGEEDDYNVLMDVRGEFLNVTAGGIRDKGKLPDASIVDRVKQKEAYIKTILNYYGSNILLVEKREQEHNFEIAEWKSWKDVEIELDRDIYVQSVFRMFYELDLKELQTDSGVQESELEHFRQNTQEMVLGINYCTKYALAEYREAFLADVCDWWKREIFFKDPNVENFFAKSERYTGNSRENLEIAYMAQIRRILCSFISDRKPILSGSSETWKRLFDMSQLMES